MTDVATVDESRRLIEAAAKMAAKLQDGMRERAAAHGPSPQPVTPPHTQSPGVQPPPGPDIPTGGVR
ncbi:hypothetical protein ABT088_52710 [Streptomyces mirabilis]|uniref:hypothetical protein n=1 Tax=Streptomyces mirabilis TaxID=68239 RepID=UPI0029C9FE4D|nr:hypothetical protein [Streptomyces sp. AK02-04a]